MFKINLVSVTESFNTVLILIEGWKVKGHYGKCNMECRKGVLMLDICDADEALIALATWNRQYKIKHSNYEVNSEGSDIR